MSRYVSTAAVLLLLPRTHYVGGVWCRFGGLRGFDFVSAEGGFDVAGASSWPSLAA